MNKFKKLLALAIVIVASLAEVSCDCLAQRARQSEDSISCGKHVDYKQLPNWEISSPGQFPFLVQVKSINGSRTRECAGALFREADAILTSFECFEMTGNYQLASGSHVWGSTDVIERNGKKEVYRPSSKKKPYRCDAGPGLDIVVLKEKLPLFVPKMQETRQAIMKVPINRLCFNEDDEEEILIGKPLLAVGWKRRPSENKQAIATEVFVIKCQGEEDIDLVICISGAGNLSDWLLGSVLVRESESKQWEVIGVYTKIGGQSKIIDARRSISCNQGGGVEPENLLPDKNLLK